MEIFNDRKAYLLKRLDLVSEARKNNNAEEEAEIDPDIDDGAEEDDEPIVI